MYRVLRILVPPGPVPAPGGAVHPGAPGLVPVPVPGVLCIPVLRDRHGSQGPCTPREGARVAGLQEGSLWLWVPVPVGSGFPFSAPFSLAGDTTEGRGWGHPERGKEGPRCLGPGSATGQGDMG